MLVLLLFMMSGMVGLLSFYSSKLKIFSPTFLSSSVISIFCAIYLLCYRHVNADISILSVIAVMLMICATKVGEFLANQITIKRIYRSSGYIPCDATFRHINSIKISKKRTYIIFALELYAGISRFIRLYLFTVSIGNINILDTLRRARPYLSGGMNHDLSIDVTTIDVSIISYLAEPIAYFYCFWFMYHLVIMKQRKMYLLLPVVGDALILMSSTSRTVFLVIGTAFVTSYAYLENMNGKTRKFNHKLIFCSVLFIVAFFVYGNVTRGKDASFGIREIFGYSSAGIYGLTEYFNDPWDENVLFGQRTLKPLYDLMGNSVANDTNNTVLPFYIWGYDIEDYSNLYSSLALPIHDYGLFGMFLIRTLLTFMAVKMIKLLFREKISDYKTYILLFYVNQFVYSYLSCLIADRFYAFLTNIRLLIINIIFTYIAVRWTIKWELTKC